MNISRIRRLSLLGIIGFLSLSALVAVLALLAGSFSGTTLKILLTTLTISGASICAMACAAFIERRDLPLLGTIGIACAVLAAMLATLGIWLEVGKEPYWKTTITLIVASVAFAHAFLLFIPTLGSTYRWTQIGASFFIGFLALLIIAAACAEVRDSDYYRLIGVISVVVVLLTLVVPILSKMRPDADKQARPLKLTHLQDEIYEDAAGQRYRVSRIERTERFDRESERAGS